LTWTDVTVAGAFIAGLVSGCVATVRLTRIIYDRYRDQP